MKVICAGFWKTGTKSLAEALRLLGYKVFDYDDQFLLTDLWVKFFNGSVTDEEIRKRLEDVDVLVDGFPIAFWEEIARVFPEAKVILSTRDEDSWWNSFKRTKEEFPAFYKYGLVLMMLAPSGMNYIWSMIHLMQFCLGVEGSFSLPMFGFNGRNSRLYKYKFRQHNSHVLNTIPEKNLLVFPVGSSWEPLCRFLNHDIPDTPFPRKNVEGAHFTKEGGPKSTALNRVLIEMAIILGLLCAVLVCFVYWFVSYLFL